MKNKFIKKFLPKYLFRGFLLLILLATFLSPVTGLFYHATPVYAADDIEQPVIERADQEMEDPLTYIYVDGQQVAPIGEDQPYILDGSGYYHVSANDTIINPIVIIGTGHYYISGNFNSTSSIIVLNGYLNTFGYDITCESIFMGEYTDSTPISVNINDSTIICDVWAVRGDGVTVSTTGSIINANLLFDDTDKSGRNYNEINLSDKEVETGKLVYAFMEGANTINKLDIKSKNGAYINESISVKEFTTDTAVIKTSKTVPITITVDSKISYPVDAIGKTIVKEDIKTCHGLLAGAGIGYVVPDQDEWTYVIEVEPSETQHYLYDATSDLYWISGTGLWSDPNHWSLSSGGAGGHNVPTSTNNVAFDVNSFSAEGQVVTVDAAASCLDMDWTGAANSPTLTVSSILSVNGSCTLIAAMTTGGNSTIRFYGAGTLTTNGLALGTKLQFMTGSNVTLADALTSTDYIYASAGALNTANFNVGCTTFGDGNASSAITLTLGSSTITCTSFSFSVTTVTAAANTATINISGTGACALGDADWNGASFNLTGTAHTVSGSPTGIATFTRTGTATKTDSVTFTSGTTLTCTTFAMIGNSITNRLKVRSSTLGTPATITATNWTGTANVNIMDITATNAVDLSAITGGSGDCQGNTGITFTTPADQISATTDNWSVLAKWQDGVGTDRVPLPQDNVTCSHSSTIDMTDIGKSITFVGAITVTRSLTYSFYGSLTLSATMTFNGGFYDQARGRGSYTITSNGVVFTRCIQFYAPTGTYTLQDAYNWSISNSLEVYYGTFVSNNKGLTGGYAVLTGTGLRTINLGSSIMTLTGDSPVAKWNVASTTNLTFDAGTSTIILTNSTANAQTFAGGGLTYNNVKVAGAGAYDLTVTGNNTFQTFEVDASSSNKTIVATGTTQTVNNFIRDTGTNNINVTGGTWTKHGRLADGTGTFTGAPVYFDNLNETIIASGNGTAIVTLPHGVTGTATSGASGATVTDSPKALVAGANTIEVTMAGDNTFTITTNSIDSIPIALDYLTVTNSTAVPANVWYAGSNSTDGTGNTDWLFDDPVLTVTTNVATAISMNKDGVTGVTFNGTIAQIDGTPTITIKFEYGLTPAYGSSTADVIVYASGNYTANPVTTLTPGATYHYRFVGTNSNGTTNGADQTFDFTMPSITTGTATDLTNHSATLVGNISSMGDATSTYAWFEWGLTNAYGNSTALQTISGIGNVSGDPVGLLQNTPYHFRMNVTNGATTVNGADVTFTPIAYTGGNNLAVIVLPIIFLVAIIFGVLRFVSKSEQISNNRMLLICLIVVIIIVGLALLGVVQNTLNGL